MKLIPNITFSMANADFPEQKCSGLIEASFFADACPPIKRDFPEQKCSGLIEAYNGWLDRIVGKVIFRSRNAPASLKLWF